MKKFPRIFWLVLFYLSSLVIESKSSTKHQAHGSKSVPASDFLYYDSLNGQPYTVTSDERSFIINGQRTLLLGGSIHYPRLSPGQWNDILSKARNDGLNHIETYVFWNIHEPFYDFSGNHKYTFEGRANLTGFLQTAADNGLFVNLRIGPYVCAEWSFGGLPAWLLHIPDIYIRANNTGWKSAMSQFVRDLIPIIEPYLARNGGPIILAQIDNEYHSTWDANGYIEWCGNFANSLNISIPWLMCNGQSANNTINTCNGDNCYSYAKTHGSKFSGQPLGWTENEGWFQDWGWNNKQSSHVYIANKTGWANRSPEDMANSVAIWFAAGGSHHNYYMWYGGNHVSWTAGSGITNYYADGVNYYSDGLVHEPKRSHLNKLHNILANKQKILLNDNIQVGNEILINNNSKTFAYVYGSDAYDNETVTFLVNYESKTMDIEWENGITYNLPSESVSIIDNEGVELYNSGKVDTTDVASERVYKTIYSGKNDLIFQSWNEYIPLTENKQNRSDTNGIYSDTIPYEQIRFTNNTSEYLYYSTKITTNFTKYVSKMANNEIMIQFEGRYANAYDIWLNSNYMGTTWNGFHDNNYTTMNVTINNFGLDCSNNNINCELTVLSSMLGIDNKHLHGSGDEMDKKGLTGDIELIDASNNEIIDSYTSNGWTHWIASTGENLNITGSGMNKIEWTNPAKLNNAMTWYYTTFETPDLSMFGKIETIKNENGLITKVFYNEMEGSFLLDIGANGLGFQRGHFWLNGRDMGHYNSVKLTASDGTIVMAQQYYYIPIDYLVYENEFGSNENVLIFEEELPLTQYNVNNFDNVNLVYSTVVIPNN